MSINLENCTTNEPRTNPSVKKNKQPNSVTQLPLFLQNSNPPFQLPSNTTNAIDPYEELCVYNGLEVRNSVRTEDIVDDTDPSINLHDFFLEQLRESKDRMYLLQLEDQFVSLIQDTPHTLHYQHVTSYHRMLIHRMATYFGLHHTLDDEGTGVNVTKVAKSRLPETRFCDLIPPPQEEESSDKEPVVILRRKYHSEQLVRPNPQVIRPSSPATSDSESKSIKQREETYAMVRARIFEGEGPEGEMVPSRSEDSIVQNEMSSFHNSTDSSASQDPPKAAQVPDPIPAPVISPPARPKEETDPLSSSNNNKTHSNGTNTRRRYESSNRHSRSKNSFPSQQPSQPHPSQLFVPPVSYLQVGSFYTPQNENNLPIYPFARQPAPPTTHSGPPVSLPPHPNIPLLPPQSSIPMNSQHFLSHPQRPENSPFIPGPHMNPPPQSAIQVPINPTSTVNPSFSQYPANFPLVGLQAPSNSLLQRAATPAYQPIQSASDVMSYLPPGVPSYEPPKEEGYVYMQNYPQMGSHGYPGVQWEPGVMKVKHLPNPHLSQQQTPQSVQQLTSCLEMMGLQSGEDHVYLQPNSKQVAPEMYPNYSPYPTPQIPPNSGQGVYMQNNVAFLPYQHYQNQDGSHSSLPMSNSRIVLTHPTPVTASMSLSESGYPLMTSQPPMRNIIPNIPPAGSLSNGQLQYVTPGHINSQIVQQNILSNHLGQNIQDFQMNNPNFKPLKQKSTDLPFNHENNRSKMNRHTGSRHRTHQGGQQVQHKPCGSIYIPPRSGLDNHLQTDKDGLLPTPASMRILEIFELKVSFEEAERCVRGLAHVHVEFHYMKPPSSNHQVLLAIFESDQLTDILNKINSNPATKFKTRFPDQNLVKYLQQTTSN